jgi:hypothetical protein
VATRLDVETLTSDPRTVKQTMQELHVGARSNATTVANGDEFA